jgi:DNA-binding transcriptional MerR regulator/methylmalonyl-CoA mutase cobalamin-binding subunit
MISIGAAAMQTGISADVLRKWETRYGFPIPLRTSGGQRAYQDSDLALLHQVARGIAAGQRAAVAIRSVLEDNPGTCESAPNSTTSSAVFQSITLLLSNDLKAYGSVVEGEFVRLGLMRFCLEFAVELIGAVGACWQAGTLPIYAEHAFSQHLQELLFRYTKSHVPPAVQAPRLLLALPAGESHSLALMLLNAVLFEAGFSTILFQSGLPASEIAAAAIAYDVNVVAISCSSACGKRQLQDELRELRKILAPNISMWVGGEGALRMPGRVHGVEYFSSLDDALARANAIGLPVTSGFGKFHTNLT